MDETTRNRRKIEALAAAYGHYPAAAYEFIFDTVAAAVARLGEARHISAAELLEFFHLYLKENFGPMAPAVLEEWHIHAAADVGAIVYQLISIRLLSAAPEDRESDFAIPFELVDRDGAAVPDEPHSWKGPKID